MLALSHRLSGLVPMVSSVTGRCFLLVLMWLVSVQAGASYVWVSGSCGGNGLVTRSLSCYEVASEAVKGQSAIAGQGAVTLVDGCSGVVTAVDDEYSIDTVIFNPPGTYPQFVTVCPKLSAVLNDGAQLDSAAFGGWFGATFMLTSIFFFACAGVGAIIHRVRRA